MKNTMGRFLRLTSAGACLLLLPTASALAGPPAMTVGYQPMVSTGLAAKQPFEGWFVFNMSADPRVPGAAMPANAAVRFTFPKAFVPLKGPTHLEGALLYGWPHGAIPVPFTVTQDVANPRAVTVVIAKAISANPPDQPGLKAIHVRTGEINPSVAGDYPIGIEFINAGALSGKTTAIAHITAKPLPNIAAFNQLHQSKDEDWQHVKTGAAAALPLDYLVTLPDASRSTITLGSKSDGGLDILRDGMPIGSIVTKGVSVSLTPHPFGPGFSRLGLIEVSVKAVSVAGEAQIIASLKGGLTNIIHIFVEQP